MIDRILHFSLRNKLLILLAAALVMLAGMYTANKMDVDVFPDLTAPTVVVLTDAHDMAAEEVERMVSFPIETAVNGATDVRRVRSRSAQGFSFVWVEFDWGTDILEARQIVSEKLVTLAGQMPIGVSQPVMAPQSSVMGEIMFVSLQADSTDVMALRTLAEWEIKPALMATGGVSQVTIIGGDYKQYKILADPFKLSHYGISIEELAEACEGISSNSNGGVLRQYGNEYIVRGVARTSNTNELGNTLIKNIKGHPVRINDVADVVIAPAVKMGAGSRYGEPAIILSISKQPNVNTLNLTHKIDEVLENLKSTLPADVVVDSKIFRQGDFIQTSINNVQNALVEGAILVIIILFMFLGSFRTTVISLLAIPISLLVAVLTLKWLGININTMSLGGLTIAIGSLVDDAIIDVENVYRRLRENNAKDRSEREPALKIVFEASKEIRASILNATLIIMVAFVPLFFLTGMEGRMLKPLGIAYIVSLFASLVVAVTVTPILCQLLLSNEKYLNKKEKEPALTVFLKKYYSRSLNYVLNKKTLVVGTSLGLFALAIILLSNFGRSFLPEFNEGVFTIAAVAPPGVSLDECDKLGALMEKHMLEIDEVYSTSRRTGRGELDEHAQTTNSSEIEVIYKLKDRSREELMEEMREKLNSISGIGYSIGQPLGHRIDHMLSGTRANIALKIIGPDLNKLFLNARHIKTLISDIPNLVDVNIEQQTEIPQLQIKADREMLARYGITIDRFNHFVNVALAGEKLADIYEGQRKFDLILRFNEDYTSSIDGIKKAMIRTGDDKMVPLEHVAKITSTTGPASISRENVQRKVVVSANVTGGDLTGVVDEIKRRIDEQINLGEGYRIEFGGQFESEANASRTLLLASLAAIFIIFMLLYQEFRNVTLSGIILINLPLALIGGVMAISIGSGVLSIPAIIGFITLFGIATRNGILLVSNYKHLLEAGHDIEYTITEGSKQRLMPILMTALTAALALVPLAVQGSIAGNEIQSTKGKVILGGLITSTILNVYVIPVVFKYMYLKGKIKISQS